MDGLQVAQECAHLPNVSMQQYRSNRSLGRHSSWVGNGPYVEQGGVHSAVVEGEEFDPRQGAQRSAHSTPQHTAQSLEIPK